MKNFYWNYIKKSSKRPSIEGMIKNVSTIVSPYIRLNAKIEDCHIIEMFDGILYVGYPSTSLPEGEFFDMSYNEEEGILRGTIIFPHYDKNEESRRGHRGRYFSIKNNILYIGKVVY